MVKRVFTFVYREIKGLHQAAYILALFAFGSQLLAIIRDRLLAHTFGAGGELDLYYTAFRIPDLLYVLFASVLSIYVLLPFIDKYNQAESKLLGTKVIANVFTLFLWVYGIMAVCLALLAPWYVPYLFPGFIDQADALVTLQRILLLQPFLLGLSSLCGVITQINHRFILYAISPLLYNLGIIVGIVVFYPIFDLLGLVFGVVLGALGHVLIQIPFVIKSDYMFSVLPKIDWIMIRQILTVSIPRALTLSVNQLVLLVMISIASVMSIGSVSVFQFAFNLQSVPLVIIGMSYSVAAFPTLSLLYAKNDRQGFNNQLLTALRHIIFWSLPIIGLIVVLRAQIVRVLLGSGAFDWGDTRLTAAMLALFVLSLVAQAILLLLIRAFYAGGRTFVPLVVACGSGIASLVLAVWLKFLYTENNYIQSQLIELLRLKNVEGSEVLVLALAFTLGQFIQLFILLLVSIRTFKINYKPLLVIFTQALTAALAGGMSTYLSLLFLVDGVNQETFVGISIQGLLSGMIGIIFVIVTYWLSGSKELQEIYKSFKSKIKRNDIIAPQQT